MVGDGWFFLDMDDCLVDGKWTPKAEAIYSSFNGALAEVSSSGNGLHIFGRCDPERLKDRRNKWDGWLEFYTDKRFVALTRGGLSVAGGGTYADKDWTDQLLHFVPQREHLGDLPDGIDPAYTGTDDDEQLIAQMLRSSNAAASFGEGVTVRDLWEANVTKLAAKYPPYDGKGDFDHSSADAALMSHLAFWTGKDMPRMDRLFRRSALMRDKYEKRADYRRDTVQNAARLCKSVYDRPKPEPIEIPAAAVAAGGSKAAYCYVQEMIEHFKGCVYIIDQHRMLVPDGRLLKPEQFNAVYGGYIFQMMPDLTKSTRKAFEAFTECAVHEFTKVETTCFHPDKPFGEIINGEVNVYVPAQGDAEPGDVTPFLDFLARLLPDPTDRAILMSWCCGVAQNPGKKPLWAPVIQGTEGNGKSLIGECLSYAIGKRYTHAPRAKEIGSPYNGWMEDKMLIIVNEIHMDSRRQALDDLKPFITETTVPIRRMHQTEANKFVPLAWYLTTNHKDAVIKSRADRRYAVFFSAQQSRDDVERTFPGEFFPQLWDWLRNGGFRYVAHYFMTTRADPRFDPFDGCVRAPQTSSTNEAMAATAGGVESEIVEAIESDRRGFRNGWVSSFALDQLLRERGVRMTRPRIASMLSDMGYVKWGRAPRPIIGEELSRPIIWTKGSTDTPFDVYLSDQGIEEQ